MRSLRLFVPLFALAILGAGCNGCIFGDIADDSYDDYNRRMFQQQLPPNVTEETTTYTAPEKPPRDQQTQKVDQIECPGVEAPTEATGGTVINFVKLKNGKCYWAAQFRAIGPDQCDAWHLHGDVVTAIDGTTASDPLPGEGACGFGKMNTVQEGLLTISAEQFDRVYKK